MPAEDMGKLSHRVRLAFAVSTVLCVLVLAISPVKDFRAEWKHYKRSFLSFAQGRADTKKLLADYNPNIDQAWIPGMNVVDRCSTCHQGMTQPTLADQFRSTAVSCPSADSPQRSRLGLHHMPPGPRAGNGSRGGARNNPCVGTADFACSLSAGFVWQLPPGRHQGDAATYARKGTAFKAELPGLPQALKYRPFHTRPRAFQRGLQGLSPVDLQVAEGTAHRSGQRRQCHCERL